MTDRKDQELVGLPAGLVATFLLSFPFPYKKAAEENRLLDDEGSMEGENAVRGGDRNYLLCNI